MLWIQTAEWHLNESDTQVYRYVGEHIGTPKWGCIDLAIDSAVSYHYSSNPAMSHVQPANHLSSSSPVYDQRLPSYDSYPLTYTVSLDLPQMQDQTSWTMSDTTLIIQHPNWKRFDLPLPNWRLLLPSPVWQFQIQLVGSVSKKKKRQYNIWTTHQNHRNLTGVPKEEAKLRNRS